MEINWSNLCGGYRVPYDPRPLIGKLKQDPTAANVWKELWNELHHQGDVGEASYAAVPLLVEACADGPRGSDLYGLVLTIEIERARASNPELPEWIAEAYFEALGKIRMMALNDLSDGKANEHMELVMAVIALTSGKRELGALLADLDFNEILELLEERISWSELYRPVAALN